MSKAFQIGEEDVQRVLKDMGREVSLDEAQEIVPKLDAGAIEKAALYGDDLDAQTGYAHAEIRRQIEGLELGSAGPSAGGRAG